MGEKEAALHRRGHPRRRRACTASTADYAGTSGEAADGVLRLLAEPARRRPATAAGARQDERQEGACRTGRPLAPALARYLEVIRDFNPKGGARIYPGSPFITHHLLRDHDKLKLFGCIRPMRARSTPTSPSSRPAGRSPCCATTVSAAPPVPCRRRRAVRWCFVTPATRSRATTRVLDFAAEAIKRLYRHLRRVVPDHSAAGGARPAPPAQGDGHQGRQAWLHATLTVKSSKITTDALGATHRPGLPASGMFLINPPFTLKALMAAALPQMVERLAQDHHAAFSLDSGRLSARRRPRRRLRGGWCASSRLAGARSCAVGGRSVGRTHRLAAAAIGVPVDDGQRHLLDSQPQHPDQIGGRAAQIDDAARTA